MLIKIHIGIVFQLLKYYMHIQLIEGYVRTYSCIIFLKVSIRASHLCASSIAAPLHITICKAFLINIRRKTE